VNEINDRDEWIDYYKRFDVSIGKTPYELTKEREEFKNTLIRQALEQEGLPFLLDFAKCKFLSVTSIAIFNAAHHKLEGSIDIPDSPTNPFGVPILEYVTDKVMDAIVFSPISFDKYDQAESFSYDVAIEILDALDEQLKKKGFG